MSRRHSLSADFFGESWQTHSMGRIVVGWMAVLLALFAWLPHSLPGAMCIFGFLISLAALVLSIGSVRHQSMAYFQATLILVVVGILGLNSGWRLVASLHDDIPPQFKLSLYALAGVVIAGCWYADKTIDTANRRDTLSSSQSSSLLLL